MVYSNKKKLLTTLDTIHSGKYQRNTTMSIILAHWFHYVKTWNMVLSTKPKVNNVLHCSQRRTKPRPQITCRKFCEI